MDWNLLYNVVTVLEIIAVEFTSLWLLAERKHRFAASLGLYAAVTAPLIAFMCLIATRLPGYGNGSGGFMLLGVFYFIPVLISFGGSWKDRVIVAFYSFSYGLAGFAVAVRVGYLFGEERLSAAVLIVQTLLYALTLSPFLLYSRRKVVPRIRRSDARQKGLLIRYTATSFLLIILYNLIMVADGPMLWKLLVYLLLIYFIILTYRLMVSYLKVDDVNQELSELARTDRLTGLGNRLALRGRLEALTREDRPFFLLFLDLDDFKSVNDRLGHAAGDEYLRRFAAALCSCAGPDASCFRLAGDEFICLTRDAGLYERLRAFGSAPEAPPDFRGVSVGIAKFPDDSRSVSALLELADRHMYEQKARRR